jgi:hypothetical protein
MLLTRYRNTHYDDDRLKGVYALIDPVWHSQKVQDALFADLVAKYIDRKEGALLLTMAINNQSRKTRTWAAAVFFDSEFGSFVPDAGKYPLIKG